MTTRNSLLASLLCLYAGLSSAGESLALQPAQLAALGIETAVAGDATTTRGASLPARVLVPTDQMRVVAAPVQGLVEMLAVAPGETVRRGQVVARLSSPQALELQRDAMQAHSQAALLQQTLKRDEQLFAEGLIPESRLQATRAAAAQARTLAGERRQGLAMAGAVAGTLGGSLALTSPIDGVVLEQSVQLGQRVDGTTPIYRIARLAPLWLEAQVPVATAAALSEGMALPVAGSGVAGKVINIGRVVDPASQTVLVRALVAQGTEKLRPGQVVEVELATAAGSGHRLPASALARNAGHALAFVQTAADDKSVRFEARPVKVVAEGGDSAVVEGLQGGERVAVKGVSGLKAMLSGGQE